MPVIDRPELGQIPTVPDNIKQPSRFGGITEMVKDAFVLELRHFFDTQSDRLRYGEFKRIDKYTVALNTSADPLETAVNVIRNYPDIGEDLPLIAIMATSGKNMKLGFSDKHVDLVIYPPKVVSSITSGVFNIPDGSTLIVSTKPDAKTIYQSTYTFNASMFADITNATIAEVVSVINFQALYAIAYIDGDGGTKKLAIKTGNRGVEFPNSITVVGGTAATALGFTVGQTDVNYGSGKTAMVRHNLAATLTVGLQIITESEDVRTEVTDLLYDFTTFILSDRQFTLYGRSIFDSSIIDETYQIIIKDAEVSISGEQETPRPNDPKSKYYVNRIDIPVIAIQYTDRVIVDNYGSPIAPAAVLTLVDGTGILPDPN